MPIRIPDALPATAALESENIFVMTEHRACGVCPTRPSRWKWSCCRR